MAFFSTSPDNPLQLRPIGPIGIRSAPITHFSKPLISVPVAPVQSPTTPIAQPSPILISRTITPSPINQPAAPIQSLTAPTPTIAQASQPTPPPPPISSTPIPSAATKPLASASPGIPQQKPFHYTAPIATAIRNPALQMYNRQVNPPNMPPTGYAANPVGRRIFGL